MAIRLRTATGFLGMTSLLVAAYTATTGCSDTPAAEEETPTSTVGQPPAKLNAPATTNTDYRTYAASELRIGLSDRAGVDSTTAWKSYGYNLDGKVSTESSTDTCKSDVSVKADGDNGTDNAFGRKIAPSLKIASPTFETALNASIRAGAFTLMFDVKGLTGEATQNATGLSGAIFGGGFFGKNKVPTFTPADDWPVSKDSTKSGTLESGAAVSFTDAYVSNGTFVARVPDITIPVGLAGKPLNLRLRKAIITFKINGAEATVGTLAGVLTTTEFITELKRVAPYLSPMLCGSGAALLDSFASASDIMADSTNAAGKSCDGISVGMGFSAKQIGRPSRVETEESNTTGDPCADAGH